MNTRRKGIGGRLKARKLLQSMGWKVAVSESSDKYVAERDMFGVADLVAIKKNHVMFVQVRNALNPHPHARFIKFYKEFGGDNVWVKQYHFRGRETFVYEYFDWGYNRICGEIVTVVKVRIDELSVV